MGKEPEQNAKDSEGHCIERLFIKDFLKSGDSTGSHKPGLSI